MTMELESCGNCGRGFHALSQVHKILDYRNNEKNSPEEIPINCALSLIFTNFNISSSNDGQLEIDTSAAFCSLCAHSLTVIYNAFQEFLYLRQSQHVAQVEDNDDYHPSQFAETICNVNVETEEAFDEMYEPEQEICIEHTMGSFVNHGVKIEVDTSNVGVDVDYEISTGVDECDEHIEHNESDQTLVEEYNYNKYEYHNFKHPIDSNGTNTNCSSDNNDVEFSEEETEDVEILDYFVDEGENLEAENNHEEEEEQVEESDINEDEFSNHNGWRTEEVSAQTTIDHNLLNKNENSISSVSSNHEYSEHEQDQLQKSETKPSIKPKSHLVSCDICHKFFTASQTMIKHKENTHGIHTTVYPCPKCRKKFTRKAELTRHMMKKHPVGSYIHKCTLCDKSFKQAGSLAAHMSVHTDPESITCKFCTKIFGRRSDLKRHMQNIHGMLLKSPDGKSARSSKRSSNIAQD